MTTLTSSSAPSKRLGYRAYRDGSAIIHQDYLSVATDNIQVPQIDSAYGAGFGDVISDGDRAYAATREPTAHFLTFGVAADITEKWFTINDPDTAEADPALDRTVQDKLTGLEAKKHLTEALESERIYGKSLLVGGFSDAQNVNALRLPRRVGAELLQLAVYPSTLNGIKIKEYEVYEKDENPNSPRFGLPVTYRLHRDSDQLIVHYTRVCEVQTRSNASSVLDAVWDDLVCGRNIRWGVSQWMFRTGSGFAVVGFPEGTTSEQLETYHNSGAFSGLDSRTAIFIAQNSTTSNNGMTFEFKGAAGASLDPIPFFKTNREQISVATGIPEPKLVGAQAGAVTGSEYNEQSYYKVISREQAKLEYVIRWLLDRLSESGQIKLIKSMTLQMDAKEESYRNKILRAFLKHRKNVGDYRHKSVSKYVVEWNSAFELSEKDEAAIEESRVRANQGKLDYMSKDEVRALEGLDPLPDGAGEWKDQTDLFGGEEFLVKSKQGMKPKDERKSHAQPEEDKPNDKGSKDSAGSN